MMEFIAGGLTHDGDVFSVGTDGNTNCVRWTHGSTQQWVGSPVSCACSFRDGVICISNQGDIWRITTSEVIRLHGIGESASVFGLTAFDADHVIGVGTSGSFVEIDIPNDSVNVRKAIEFGFRKPGRDLINVFRINSGLVAIGKKELVYCFEDYPNPTGSSNSTGRESFFFNGTEFDGRLWLSGLLGQESVLASFSRETNSLEYHEMPDRTRGRAACISSFRDRLLIANEQVFAGQAGDWSLIMPDLREKTVAIINRGKRNPILLTSSGGIHEIDL
jgi:hypothetical protein